MAADLATTAASGVRVRARGDRPLPCFGGFVTPERNLIKRQRADMSDFLVR